MSHETSVSLKVSSLSSWEHTAGSNRAVKSEMGQWACKLTDLKSESFSIFKSSLRASFGNSLLTPYEQCLGWRYIVARCQWPEFLMLREPRISYLRIYNGIFMFNISTKMSTFGKDDMYACSYWFNEQAYACPYWFNEQAYKSTFVLRNRYYCKHRVILIRVIRIIMNPNKNF